MKKSVVVIGLLLMASSLLFASGSKEATEKVEDENAKLKVALLLPGKKDDVSFNQAMYESMKEVEAEYSDKIEVTYVEDVYEVADIEPALMDFASRGYDLIFGHGFQYMEPIIKVAELFPETMFALGTGYKTAPNTCVYDVHLAQGGYLMGLLAAMISETGKIGVIGGADASEIYRGHEGFKMGAKVANPDIEIQEFYTGDWRDAAKAKEGALGMYDNGVDVIWHSGDGIGLGVVNAALEANKYCLSNITSQYVLAKENVVSGVNYQWDLVIRQILDDVLSDNFMNQEKFYWINVENGGLAVADYHQFKDEFDAEIFTIMDQAIEDIKTGVIEIPDFEK
jgi:basic membrane protein A